MGVEPEPASTDSANAGPRGTWKRKRRSILARIFRKSTLIALVVIGAALVILWFLLQNLGMYREPD